MEIYRSKKKLYGFIERNKSMELEGLQRVALSINRELEASQNKIDEKKKNITAVLNKLDNVREGEFFNIQLFGQYYEYLTLLQDELVRDEILSRSLSKRYTRQLEKVKEKYQEAKLYKNIIEKNNIEMDQIEVKKQEKELEDVNNKSIVDNFLYE